MPQKPRIPASPPLSRAPLHAAHVRAALGEMAQAKPQNRDAPVPAAHVQSAIAQTRTAVQARPQPAGLRAIQAKLPERSGNPLKPQVIQRAQAPEEKKVAEGSFFEYSYILSSEEEEALNKLKQLKKLYSYLKYFDERPEIQQYLETFLGYVAKLDPTHIASTIATIRSFYTKYRLLLAAYEAMPEAQLLKSSKQNNYGTF